MSDTHHGPANGAHTTDGTPHGFTSITPFLVVREPGAAIDFYQAVFGAQLVSSAEMGGVIAHAELAFDNGRMQVGAAQEQYGLTALDPGAEASQFSLALYVPWVDDVVARAVEAGAELIEPLDTFVSGDRYATLRDPFGVRWTVMTRVEDLSDEESSRRVDEWAAQFNAGA